MNIRSLVEQLKLDEGFHATPYFDNDQYSWGYGTRAPSRDGYITKDDAEKELWQRAALAIRDYYILFKYTTTEINEVRQLALCNMLYNLGITKMAKFRDMLAAIEAGNWREASAQAIDSVWYKQVGNRAKRIADEIRTGETK